MLRHHFLLEYAAICCYLRASACANFQVKVKHFMQHLFSYLDEIFHYVGCLYVQDELNKKIFFFRRSASK